MDKVHLVSKLDNTQHTVAHVTERPEPLKPNCVRAKACLISLTSTSLTYAMMGSMLHWWDAFAVPENDRSLMSDEWGIVQAWGFGKVVDSTIVALPPGSVLWGCWPTSEHAVDLRLEPRPGVDGHWIETTTARAEMMSLYNQYRLVADASELAGDRGARTAFIKPVFEAGLLLSSGVFNPSAPIHPLGAGTWSADDADLTSAVVASLGASSKTGRSFAWAVARRRRRGSGPLALLQVTSSPSTVANHGGSETPVKTVSYAELAAGMDWLAGFKSSKLVILNFAAGLGTVKELAAMVPQSRRIVIVGVGREPRIFSPSELKDGAMEARGLSMLQLNTSGLRDVAMKGREASYFAELDDAWNSCLDEGVMDTVKYDELRGVGGDGGIEGAWTGVCHGRVSGGSGYVIRMNTPL